MRRSPVHLSPRRGAVWALALSAAVLIACSDSSDPSGDASAGPDTTVATTERCLVRLHGKGGGGAETVVEDGVSIIAPDGNAEGWGGLQWIYFPDDEYAAARDSVEDSINGCSQVIVNGFSNGGAFAAKLYCRGETLDGRLVRVVVDDPVVDEAVQGCSPDPSVGLTLYWTGALEAEAQPDWDCSEGDWTCEGGRTIGIDAYAAALGTRAMESPFEEHEWYLDAPELSEWHQP